MSASDPIAVSQISVAAAVGATDESKQDSPMEEDSDDKNDAMPVEDLTGDSEDDGDQEQEAHASSASQALSLSVENTKSGRKRKSYNVYNPDELQQMHKDGTLDAALSGVAWSSLRAMFVGLGGKIHKKVSTEELLALLTNKIEKLPVVSVAAPAPAADQPASSPNKRARPHAQSPSSVHKRTEGFLASYVQVIIKREHAVQVAFHGDNLHITAGNRLHTWRIDAAYLALGSTISEIVSIILDEEYLIHHLVLLDWIATERLVGRTTEESKALGEPPYEIDVEQDPVEYDLKAIRNQLQPLAFSTQIR